ncbi:hypothetical protein JCM18899A_01030 [Nocardioides sp. AN3]
MWVSTAAELLAVRCPLATPPDALTWPPTPAAGLEEALAGVLGGRHRTDRRGEPGVSLTRFLLGSLPLGAGRLDPVSLGPALAALGLLLPHALEHTGRPGSCPDGAVLHVLDVCGYRIGSGVSRNGPRGSCSEALDRGRTTSNTTLCSQCGALAEVKWRDVLESTDGPVENAKVACARWHLVPAPGR